MKTSPIKLCVLDLFQGFLSRVVQSGVSTAVNPGSFCQQHVLSTISTNHNSNQVFSLYQQHDSADFLEALLNKIESEELQSISTNGESVIYKNIIK